MIQLTPVLVISLMTSLMIVLISALHLPVVVIEQDESTSSLSDLWTRMLKVLDEDMLWLLLSVM